MSDRVTIECVGTYPIPVGHRVEVRMFEVPTGLTGRRLESRPQEPWVVDLETGIVYGHGWQFTNLTMLRACEPVKLEPGLRADLREIWRVTAVVDACRIAWLSIGTTHFPQTKLVLRQA